MHVGRGGAGNWTKKEEEGGSERKGSEKSARSGLLGRLSGVLERR